MRLLAFYSLQSSRLLRCKCEYNLPSVEALLVRRLPRRPMARSFSDSAIVEAR